jgi:hypothetical protein
MGEFSEKKKTSQDDDGYMYVNHDDDDDDVGWHSLMEFSLKSGFPHLCISARLLYKSN